MGKAKMKYYHIWFQTKYRRFLLVEIIDKRINELFEQIAEEKKIKLLAHGTLLFHAHILIGIEDIQELSWSIKMFKGISARKIFQEFPMLKEQFRTNNLWAKRYAFKEIPENQLPIVVSYIHRQKDDLYVV